MALRFGNHRLPLLDGKFQNSPQALRLIQSGPPNIHQWAGIINQLRASNCGIQRRFRSRRGHRLPSCVFVASKDDHSAIFHPQKYISLLRITACSASLSYFTSKSGKSISGQNNRAGFAGQHLQVLEPDRDGLLRTQIPRQCQSNGGLLPILYFVFCILA